MHQLISFKYLFPHMRPGGLYIVEDVETSYADRGTTYGYPLSGGLGRRSGNAVEKFKDLVDVVMRAHFWHSNYTVIGQDVDRDIVRVSFGDGVLFVEKRPSGREWRADVFPSRKRSRREYFWWQFEQPVKEHLAKLAQEEQIP
eukprot:TRINITY_DN49014_c0_g1_i1.p1 TRINITY_DN49014_c0_g1~~TRINITY_DN49014_c0_g1_i1.p1  ORF type:complete len:143 (-),score=22.89 TRINITY_DN49014_c0_g1_i1:25-453(-)